MGSRARPGSRGGRRGQLGLSGCRTWQSGQWARRPGLLGCRQEGLGGAGGEAGEQLGMAVNSKAADRRFRVMGEGRDGGGEYRGSRGFDLIVRQSRRARETLDWERQV